MQTETNVKELVTASVPLEREIFLISKLKKREPRRSFDISDLRKPSLQSLFAENNNLKDPSQTSSEETIPGYRVEKSQIGEIYNRAVDNGRLMEKDTQGLSSSEKHILSALLKLRLTSVKSLKPEKNLDLSADLELINQLLKSSVLSKKRTEELLRRTSRRHSRSCSTTCLTRPLLARRKQNLQKQPSSPTTLGTRPRNMRRYSNASN